MSNKQSRNMIQRFFTLHEWLMLRMCCRLLVQPRAIFVQEWMRTDIEQIVTLIARTGDKELFQALGHQGRTWVVFETLCDYHHTNLARSILPYLKQPMRGTYVGPTVPTDDVLYRVMRKACESKHFDILQLPCNWPDAVLPTISHHPSDVQKMMSLGWSENTWKYHYLAMQNNDTFVSRLSRMYLVLQSSLIGYYAGYIEMFCVWTWVLNPWANATHLLLLMYVRHQTHVSVIIIYLITFMYIFDLWTSFWVTIIMFCQMWLLVDVEHNPRLGVILLGFGLSYKALNLVCNATSLFIKD